MTEWIISSTILMLIVIGLRAVLKGKVSLRLQYALWLLVLVRLLVPFHFAESTLSVHGAAEQAMETPVMQTVTEFAEIRPEIRDYAEARTIVAAEYEAQGIALNSLSKQELREFDQQVDARRNADYTVGDVAAYALGIAWIAGMAVTAVCLLMTNLRFGLRLRRSRRALPVPGCELPVYVTGAVETPCLFGFPKPAIYLPADTPWDEAAMEHILTHERTHYRHGDHIWAVLRCVCLAVHWYNPLVWVCAALSRRDGELACDEASIRSLGEEHRAAYGRTLIDMTCQKPRGMVGLTATTMNYSAKSLKERILLIARHPKTAAYTLVLVIALAALAVGCTFTGTPEETAEPTEPTTVTTEVLPDDAQLEVFQSLFDWSGDMVFNRAASHAYTQPADVDLYYLFYNGVELPAQWAELSTHEQDLLLATGYPEGQDTQSLPGTVMDEKLQQYFGVGLGAVQIPAEWDSDPETETWYSHHPAPWMLHVTVKDFARTAEGTVQLSLLVDTFVDTAGELLYDANTIMTLRPMEDGSYQIVSHVLEMQAPQPTEPEDNRLLDYQTLFRLDSERMYNLAAGIVYTRPQDVDLYYLFYNGVGYSGGWASVPQSDRDLMVSHGFWQEIDIQIMPAHLLEEKLQRYFGVGLDEVRIPPQWVYSSVTDTYYSNHNDAFGSGVTVNGYAENEDGTVVLFMVVDTVFNPATQTYLSEIPMQMTLLPSGEGWQIVSNVVANVSMDQGDLAKIDYYQTLLGWSGGLDYFRALGTIFNTTEDVDLYYFFYGGVDVPARWDEMDEYERDILLAQGFDPDFDVQKLPGEVMEERLQRYFGLGLDAFRIPEEWASDPETETWYTNHSDAWLPYVTVTGVEEYADGTVRVYLTVDVVIDHTGESVSNAETVLTLRRTEDGGYHMVTHTFAQDVV